MPPIAQRLREPAAFVLLGYGAISTLFYTITFLFGPGSDGEPFSNRAHDQLGNLVSPVTTAALLGAVMLAHLGTRLKSAKAISLIALIAIAMEALFGVVALFSSFGVDSQFESGWNKTVTFFVGLGALAIAGLAGWLILAYFQQHGPARPPANPYGQPPAGGQQWGPPPQAPQQQWGAPPAPPAQGQWGAPPQAQPQAPQQPWGAPPPAGPQGGFNANDAMATQVVPAVPAQPPVAPPAQDGQGTLPVGNWTTEG